MGDREFAEFLDGKGNEEVPSCQKRLLFDIIKQKMDSSVDLLDILTNMKSPKIDIVDWMEELAHISKQSFEQLDYLMSIVLDEINDCDSDGGEDEDEESN
jgi:hypothetical protein